MVSWAHASLLPSGISIGSAAFAWLTGVLITQTDKQILLQFTSVEIEASTSSTVGGNVSSAGWQVTLCDPMWHVSSRSGVATLRTAIHLLLTTSSTVGGIDVNYCKTLRSTFFYSFVLF